MSNVKENKKKGYVMVWRSMFEHPLWLSEKFTKAQAWIDLLQLAHYSKEPSYYFIRGNKVDVEYGFVCVGKKHLERRWKWSNKKLNLYLKHLQKASQITLHESHVITRIEINNFEQYQEKSIAESQPEASQSERQKHTSNKYNKEEEREVLENLIEKFDITVDAEFDKVFDQPFFEWLKMQRGWESHKAKKALKQFASYKASKKEEIDTVKALRGGALVYLNYENIKQQFK